MNRITRAMLLTVLVCVLFALGLPAGDAQAQTAARYVALNGNDANPGTLSRPWRTLKKSLRSLGPGQTLFVRGGIYTERVTGFTLPKGAPTARITVRAYPGERPVVKGLLWLTGADYWTFSGLNVTWDPATGRSNEHMLKFNGGIGWAYSNAEIWGARSYAAILVTGAPASYRLSYLNVHDTYAANEQWQDHLIYVNSYAGGSGGVIERNILWNSLNGRAIKIGPSSSSTATPVGNVVIRYNTMYNNLGPANINLSYSASNVRIERNIMQRVNSRKTNIDVTSLAGRNNTAANNLGWGSAGVVSIDSLNLRNAGDNRMVNPQFTNVTVANFKPLAPAAVTYGRFAP